MTTYPATAVSELPIFLPPSPAGSPIYTTSMQFVPTLVDQHLAKALLERGRLVAPDGTLTRKQVNLRPVKAGLVTSFADDMIDGEWRMTHEAVAILPDGGIHDGQHRLLAVLQAYRRNPNQKPVPLLMCYNADATTFGLINTGKSRNIGDTLAIEKFEHTAKVGHAARLLYCYLSTLPGTPQTAASMRISREPNTWARIKVSNQRLLQILREHPGLTDNAAHTISVATGSKLSAGALITARYLLTRASGDAQAVHDFLEIVRTGEGHPYPKHPAFKLRDWSLKSQSTPAMTRTLARIAKGPLHLRLLITFWNHSVEGRTLEKVFYKRDGLIPDIKSGIPATEVAGSPVVEEVAA